MIAHSYVVLSHAQSCPHSYYVTTEVLAEAISIFDEMRGQGLTPVLTQTLDVSVLHPTEHQTVIQVQRQPDAVEVRELLDWLKTGHTK